MTGERVGFVGLGRMGLPMAYRLAGAGYTVVVFNRTGARIDALRAAIAQASDLPGTIEVADSPAAVASSCETTVTMLADGAAAEAVFDGPEGIFWGVREGAILIEMSTIGPALARELAQRALAVGAKLVDAPVSGSVPAATAGTLVAMVGGDEDAFARTGSALGPLTASRFHVGPSGAGAAMKLALNSVLAAVNEALAEALVLAERSGIDGEVAWEIFEHSAIGSRYVTYKRDAFVGDLSGDVAFSAALMRKDLTLAIALGQALDVPLSMAGTASSMLTVACATGHSDEDLAVVADVLRSWGRRGTGQK